MRAIPVSAHPGSTRSPLFSLTCALLLGAVLCPVMLGQEAAPSTTSSGVSPLITQAIDESQLTMLTGNVYPLARKEFDLGVAPASLPMERMLLVLKHSPAQDAALRRFLDEQQDQSSPNYHQWLTPEQFGQEFGPTDADIQTITNWLQSHGFQVGTTKGRTVLEFSGSASQVQAAFHTEIHRYVVNGELHWANASDPQIPTALAPAVAGIDSLHDFPRKAMNRYVGKYSEKTKKVTSPSPSYSFGCGSGQTCYGVAPYDFAAIYDVQKLWNAGINGTGQTIAIVGRTDINPSDATTFWSLFGLSVPANKLNIITNGLDPGVTGDEAEADIDTQWSGAVAPQARIDYVTSASTETTDGVDLSAVYIVENNLAPVLSESYGQCELSLGTAGNQFYNALWAQAAAQGISVFVSAGDNGAAGCDDPSSPAQYGLNVNGLASTAFNAAIGGTDFNEYQTWTTYWNATNNSTTQASALGYIPETTWNDSCTNALAIQLGYGANAEQACNNSQMAQAGGVNSTGGSGGKSSCVVNTQTIGSCSKGYQKPSWQKGTGVPADNVRDLPDVSLFASNGFLNSFYVICQSDQTNGTCDLNNFLGYGGTSVASPAFAGIMALVNQKTGKPQGVPGFSLYQLVSVQSNAFHDVPSGSTIRMPCVTGSPNCVTNTAGDGYGVLNGYDTTAGYDLATGLGSVDAANLVNNWTKATFTSTTATLSLNNGTAVNVTHGASVPVSVGINPSAATGNVALLVDVGPGTTTGQAIAAFPLSGGGFTGNTSMLPGGTYNVIAHYGGDGTYGGSYSSSTSVTVNKENSQPQIFLVTFNADGSVSLGNTTTATYGSPYWLRVNVNNSAGQPCNPVATSNPTACPTGTVALTDNGNSLDAGTYKLNSYGYFEDQTVQLPGGTNSIQASYSGDASFNASAPTQAITITPANTSISTPSVSSSSVGATLSANVTVQSQSSGAAPTGTVTFLVNGTAVSGTVTYSGAAGSGSNSNATLTASFTSSASPFTKVGTYSITASYGGDANYGPSTSGATSLLVQYPAPVTSASPVTQTVAAGSTATVTALVDSANKAAYPTGSVTLLNAQTSQGLGSSMLCTNATDASGNYACAVTLTFNPTSTTSVVAYYSGDINYPTSTSAAVTVDVPDFSIAPGSQQLTVTQGQNPAPPLTLNVSALYGFTGAVSFSCQSSSLPAETRCAFTPATVTGSGSTALTITTAAVGQARPVLGRKRMGWMGIAMFSLLGICLIGIPAWGRKRGVMAAMMLIAAMILLPSCGGGNGGGGSQNNPVPSISSLSPTQQVAGSQSQTLTINGSGFISSSSVTYDGQDRGGTYVSPSQLTVILGTGDMATTGSFPVLVTNPAPGGGASSPVDFKVVAKGTPTGTYNVNVTATSGSLSHTTTFQLIVQSQ
jgi:hypothetical protein